MSIYFEGCSEDFMYLFFLLVTFTSCILVL